MPPYDAAALRHHRCLVGRMASGETEALRELHRLHVGRIYNVVARILRDREEAREAVQDAFVKAWRQAGTYRAERGEVAGWLLFIARHTAIDRLRQSRRRQAALAELAADGTGGERPAPPAAEGREFLDRHLADLAPAQREALELAFFSGCSQAEIAQRMQSPVSTIKNHLHRGLLRLRELTHRHD